MARHQLGSRTGSSQHANSEARVGEVKVVEIDVAKSCGMGKGKQSGLAAGASIFTMARGVADLCL